MARFPNKNGTGCLPSGKETKNRQDTTFRHIWRLSWDLFRGKTVALKIFPPKPTALDLALYPEEEAAACRQGRVAMTVAVQRKNRQQKKVNQARSKIWFMPLAADTKAKQPSQGGVPRLRWF